MENRKDLAKRLGISERKLNFFLFVLTDDRKYNSFEIKKRNGSSRTIDAPVKPLKEIQKNIADLLNDIYEISAPKCVHGFRRQRSSLTNARVHLSKRAIIKIDFQDYFNNITGGMVYKCLTSHPYKFAPQVAYAITNICTFKGYLPQGGPASPILANMVTRSLDIKMMSFAQATRANYTRYADDITISFTSENQILRWIDESDGVLRLQDDVTSIIENKNFKINSSKIRLRKYYKRQIVGGIIVNNKRPGISRDYLKETKLLIYMS